MHKIQLSGVALSALASVALATNAAHAAVGEPEEHPPIVGQVTPGTTLEGHAGYGFDPAYDLGFGGRLGYTLRQGIYLGGLVDHFIGTEGAPKQNLVGGEAGLKLFPAAHLEIRPYGFAGAGIPSVGKSALALAPGVVAAYHFGRAFVDADARYLATPAPNVFTILGGGGIGF